MRTSTRFLSLAALLAGAPLALHAQDVLAAAPANYTVLAENAHVRVVQGTLRPGESEPAHSHPAGWYYVTQGGTMQVTFADGRTETWKPKTGESFWGEAEGAHTSRNVGRTPLTYVLVEIKAASSAAAGGR